MKTQEFIEKLRVIGGKGYLVGGAVRDGQMGVPVSDRDYCVVGVTQQEFEKTFPKAIVQGKGFPVYVLTIDGESSEVALARTEKKIGEGHKGFEIVSNEGVTLEEDLSRRDLTMNAMAIDLETGELIDPFNGKQDIQNKILKHTTVAFNEDPLRVYRVARFSSKYRFGVDRETIRLMADLKGELKTISIERVIEETKKALLTDTPSNYFRVLKEASVLSEHYPEVDVLDRFNQPKEYHPEGDVFEHTMQVLDATRYFAKRMPVDVTESQKKRKVRELMVSMSALLHDVGKAVTQGVNPKTGGITYRDHESKGVPIARGFLTRFKLPSWSTPVLYGVENHMLMHRAIGEMKTSKLVDLIENKFALKNHVDERGREQNYIRKEGIRSAMGIHDFIALCMADSVGRLSDRTKLTQVMEVVHAMAMMYREERYEEASIEGEKLQVIIESQLQAKQLIRDIHEVLKNKAVMEFYDEGAKGIKATIVVDGKKDLYSGEELGYLIHEDKRKQRIAVMTEVRKRF